MKKLKKHFNMFISLALCITMPILFSGCKKNDTPLSFADLSYTLKEFEVAVQPFLSSLEYTQNLTEEDKAILSSVSTTISSVSYEMGESFKSFNAVIEELEANESGTVTVEKTSSSITIKNETMNFTSKLNKDKTNMSVFCKNGESEYVYELIKRDDGGYFAQIATKNNDKETYQIFQLAFLNNLGTLSVGFLEERYVSIYEAQIDETTFPKNLEKTYKNI